ncbi:hypothetical protein RND81_12G042900 [Saponaria officinalis]|uniref:WRC domain-containing protein n=1 Tax=Saponaria officinalis TaxID=3572 RepID=A0AAW1H792_SAPOF
MRIRKRKVPLPLSLLSPIPISDAHLFSRSPVTLVQQPAEDEPTPHHHHGNNSQPSDHLTSSNLSRLIDDGNSTSDHLRHDDCVMIKHDPGLIKRVPHELVGCLGFEGVEGMPKSNDTCNKSITTLGATTTEVCSHHGPSQQPPNHEDRTKWCNEDKVMPFKKRSKIVINIEEEKIIIKDDNNNNNDNIDNNAKNDNDISSVSEKKGGKRGKTIKEGSRCSRVNGRGWRCCQPTLVGYSLCEHHLGKGRLRNVVSSVRGRPSSSKKAVLGSSLSEDCSPLMRLCEAVKNESEIIVGNKRVNYNKVGVVKARSLSSLLGQTNTTSSSNGVATNVIE